MESCYRESLARADEVGAESIAFPALATGANSYPLMEAAQTAVDAVRSTPTKVNTIRFVCFDVPTLRAFPVGSGTRRVNERIRGPRFRNDSTPTSNQPIGSWR